MPNRNSEKVPATGVYQVRKGDMVIPASKVKKVSPRLQKVKKVRKIRPMGRRRGR